MQDTAYGDSRPRGLGGLISAVTKWGGAVLSLLLVASLVIWAYRLGTRDAQAVPVIRAMTGPARVTPADPGGQIAAHQGLEVNEILAGGEAGNPDAAELAPGPDSLTENDVASGNLPPIEEDEETQVATLQPTTPESEDVFVVPGGEVAGGPPRASTRPEPRPAGLAAAVAPTQNATNGAISSVRTEAAESQVPPGTRTVQLGAFASPGDARSQWERVQRDHADLLGGRSNYVQRSEQNGRTFFRLRVLGFDAAAEQNAMCDALKARNVECIPVTVR